MNDEMDRNWQAVSEEVLSGMKEWRLAHPKATFREIEQAVDERVNRLKARLLEDAALASDAVDWQEAPQGEQPVCPACQTPMVRRGQHRRGVQITGGQEVTLRRSYGTCPVCGTGLFPAFMRNWPWGREVWLRVCKSIWCI